MPLPGQRVLSLSAEHSQAAPSHSDVRSPRCLWEDPSSWECLHTLPGEGLAGSQLQHAQQTWPHEAISSKETLPRPHGEQLDTALAPQPQAPAPLGPVGLSPAPTLQAPAGLKVPLSSCPLAGAEGPCMVPGPGGDPNHQSKDGVGIGNWDLPETPLLHTLAPGKARSSLGMHRPKDCQAARPWQGGSALPRLVEELPSDSHSAQPAGLRQATAP